MGASCCEHAALPNLAPIPAPLLQPALRQCQDKLAEMPAGSDSKCPSQCKGVFKVRPGRLPCCAAGSLEAESGCLHISL